MEYDYLDIFVAWGTTEGPLADFWEQGNLYGIFMEVVNN